MNNLCKLEKIEQLFLQYDFMHLVHPNWSNEDEYNNIALIFSLSLNCYDSVASIQQKTWDIFYKYFCVSYGFRKGIKYIRKESKEKAQQTIGSVDRFFDFSKKVKEILDE